jgi:acetoacetyl-CoA synthetase
MACSHGDYITINPKTDGVIMLGRSDGTLKPGGVRFGSSDLYNVLSSGFETEISDSLAVRSTGSYLFFYSKRL